jgi:ADYC domain-containing protein
MIALVVRRIVVAQFALMLVLFAISPCGAAPRITAGATAFVATLDDGRELSGFAVKGAVLDVVVAGQPARIRIANIWRDKLNSDVLLHDFRWLNADGSESIMCPAGPDGTRAGFPVEGRSNAAGEIVASTDGHFELTCTAGVQGKCLRLGYKPWKVASNGVSMRDYYNACIHLFRADYAGDGHATTRDGTLIDIYDHIGIQQDVPPPDHRFTFEAAFGKNGATCVAHTRIRKHVTLEQLAQDVPRLIGHLGPHDCTEASAGSEALVFVKSR